LLDEWKIETTEPIYKQEVGGRQTNARGICTQESSTQTKRFHKWYMEQEKAGRDMFGFQYNHKQFLHGDRE
jgi:hypothetical protein